MNKLTNLQRIAWAEIIFLAEYSKAEERLCKSYQPLVITEP